MNGKILAIGAAGIALIGAGGYVYASPMLALNSMKSAVEAKDADALSAYIDYAALRTDFKAEAKAAMAAEATKSGDASAAAGMALGGAMIDQMVDGMVTPEGVKRLIETAPAGGAASGAMAASSAKIKDAFKDVEIERSGFSEFKLRNPKDATAAALVFKRDGLSWKLVGIDAPPTPAAK